MKNIIKSIIASLSLATITVALPIENLKQDVVNSVKAAKVEKREFRVSYDKTKIKSINSLVNRSYSGANLKNVLDTNKSEIFLIVPQQERISGHSKAKLLSFPSDANAVVAFCKENAKKQMASLGSEAQFESVDIEYTDNQDIGTKVSRVFVRYKRVFKGMKIRNSLSYAYAIYDGDGTPSGFEAKWPEFELVNVNEAADVTTADESFVFMSNQLDSPLIQENAPTSFDGKINPVSAKVVGFENSWMPVEVSGTLLITPVNTYYSEVELDNGNKITRIIDYPFLRKYLK